MVLLGIRAGLLTLAQHMSQVFGSWKHPITQVTFQFLTLVQKPLVIWLFYSLPYPLLELQHVKSSQSPMHMFQYFVQCNVGRLSMWTRDMRPPNFLFDQRI